MPSRSSVLADALGARVRAEVEPVAAVALAREVDARVVLVHRDRDVRVRLVVAQPDVEARPVLLDEVLLGEQRLGLGRDEHELDRLDRVDHLVGAARHRVGEVPADAAAQVLRLADVDHLSVGVAEQIDARAGRQRLALLGELGAPSLRCHDFTIRRACDPDSRVCGKRGRRPQGRSCGTAAASRTSSDGPLGLRFGNGRA